MRHANVLLLAMGVLDDSDSLRHVVLAFGHDFDESALDTWSDHDSVLTEQVVFVGFANDITASDDCTLFEELAWVE
jgi:hypothetical protein